VRLKKSLIAEEGEGEIRGGGGGHLGKVLRRQKKKIRGGERGPGWSIYILGCRLER